MKWRMSGLGRNQSWEHPGRNAIFLALACAHACCIVCVSEEAHRMSCEKKKSEPLLPGVPMMRSAFDPSSRVLQRATK